jgi:hypothetical protein
MRDLQLCLLAEGGAEVVDVETELTVWASDSDEEFGEEFPELLDENDVEHLLDYLEEKEVVTTRELEAMEIMAEPLETIDGAPCDDDDDDDEDWDDGDVIEGEVLEDE